MYHGHGTYEYADGSKYIGEWVDDKKEGKGIVEYPDGDRFEGIF